jgi:hypothetical protein
VRLAIAVAGSNQKEERHCQKKNVIIVTVLWQRCSTSSRFVGKFEQYLQDKKKLENWTEYASFS